MNVKCRKCKKTINKNKAFAEEYLTQTLRIMNRYFCSEECKNKYHFDEQIKDEFYSFCTKLLNTDTLKNRYFQNRLKDINLEKIYLYVYENKEEIEKNYIKIINRIEKTQKINLNYKIAVLLNTIEKEMNEYYEMKNLIEENKEQLVDYIDFESLMPKGRQVKNKKTIFD